MKAIEFLDALTREALDLEQCGMADGFWINGITPMAYFDIIEDIPGGWFKNDARYFYFYGINEMFFAFLPNSWRFFPINAERGVYVWEIDN